MSESCGDRRRTRREMLASGAAAAAGLALGGVVGFGPARAATTVANLQLGWLAGGNQLGEIAAQALGYFAEEGLELKIQPGGPSIDGVAIVASGRYEVGQVSSSPSLMLAASQDLPVKCFAVAAQQHPYAFFSLPRKPVRTAADLRGTKVGIQATGQILLRALLAKNNIDPRDVEVVIIGAEMTPLLTGQVDVVTGWLTNTTALKVLGPERIDLKLWDSGVQLYALPYYATAETLKAKRDELARFLRAAGRGWDYARSNKAKAVELLVKALPNLVYQDELEAADVMLQYAFNANTKANGWGAMDPAVWQAQIDLYAKLDQFSKRVPKLDEVMTMDILDASRDGRPKVG